MSTLQGLQPILLVEDSPEDYEAARRAFTKSRIRNPLIRVENGTEALDFLFHRGSYSAPESAPRPAVVLLDLNLPGINGFDVLKEIKNSNDLRQIPVIMLTTSDAPSDVTRCYAAGANTYIKKPVSLHAFVDAVQRLHQYWFEIALIPCDS